MTGEGTDDAGAATADVPWRRMHPLTPLIRGGFALVIAAGIVIANYRERAVEWFLPILSPGASFEGETPPDPIDYLVEHDLVPLAIAVLVGVSVVLVGLFTLAWRFRTFRITDDTVEVRSGVLFRTQRRAPLDRIQGVNIVRPLLARLCGLVKLEIVGAGNDANVPLEYLSAAAAERVRTDILRRASGLRGASGPEVRRSPVASVGDGLTGLVAGVDRDGEPSGDDVTIPLGRLIGSRLLSGSTLILIAIAVGIVLASIYGSPWMLLTLVPALLAFGAYWVSGIVRSLRYRGAATGDGVRITRGLLTTTTEVLPPGRIHAVEVAQPILWRAYGWWSLSVNRLVGGAPSGRDGGQSLLPVLPVGSRTDVDRMLALLVPQISTRDAAAIRHGIERGADGDPFTTTPRRARWLRPWSWRRNGLHLSADALFLRRGALRRRLVIVPLARMQSVQVTQGPLERLAVTAGVRAHTVLGPVDGGVDAIDLGVALDCFAATETAAIGAAASDRTHRWARGGAGDGWTPPGPQTHREGGSA